MNYNTLSSIVGKSLNYSEENNLKIYGGSGVYQIVFSSNDPPYLTLQANLNQENMHIKYFSASPKRNGHGTFFFKKVYDLAIELKLINISLSPKSSAMEFWREMGFEGDGSKMSLSLNC